MALFAFKSESVFTGVLIGFTAGFPLIINQHYMHKWVHNNSILILFISSVIYMMLLGYLFWEVFHHNKDPVGPVAFIFIGLYSLIIMIPVWIISGYLNMRFMKHQPSDAAGPTEANS